MAPRIPAVEYSKRVPSGIRNTSRVVRAARKPTGGVAAGAEEGGAFLGLPSGPSLPAASGTLVPAVTSYVACSCACWNGKSTNIHPSPPSITISAGLPSPAGVCVTPRRVTVKATRSCGRIRSTVMSPSTDTWL